MPEVAHTHLPGVGDRYDIALGSQRRMGMIAHKTGKRELLVYDANDPDACRATVRLDDDEAHALADLLGGTTVAEQAHATSVDIAGMALDWIAVPAGAPAVGQSLADLDLRDELGAIVVALVRGNETISAPGPEQRFEAGDTAVVVGPADAVARAESRLLGA
jgi:TrkA domain protein